MSSSPPPYETKNRLVLDVSERGAIIPSNNTEDTSVEEQVVVSANKKTDAGTSENASKRDAAMFQQSHNVTIIGIMNWLQNTAGDTNNINISCFIICLIVIIPFICLYFYRFSPLPIGQINRGNITHDLQRLKQFVSTGAINGSITQDPKREIYPGTREKVLSQIKHWIDDLNPVERILWLHGPAGVGKSAIAQAITDSYTTEKVPANFFFFRYDSDRNDGNRLFTTLAWQFRLIPGIKDHITSSLIEEPDLPTKNLEIQFQELIVRPFEALSDHAHQPQLPDKVVIIDGIDECVGTDIQERILKLIGGVATNPRVPLRFFISSRPENHINKTITNFQHHTLSIDLADCDDADSDIEKYFKGNFEKIAKDQGTDLATWLDVKKMQDLVCKASGQFQYASTVIKFVDGEDRPAKTQLDMILGLKPHNATQAFAELDSLYIGILEQVSDEEFLKTFLAHSVAKHFINTGFPLSYWFTKDYFGSSCFYPHLRDDYGALMDLSEEELRIKLRRMRSLLNITPDYIGLHHLSFLEFLQDPSRSGQYHIGAENARQYLMLVIDSVIRTANQSLRISEHPNYYPPVPRIVDNIRSYLSRLDNTLSREDWREALRRLEKFQDRLLNLPNFTIPRNECTIFHVVHRLQLTISYHQLFFSKPEEARHGTIMPLAPIRNQLANYFSLEIAYFRMLKHTIEMFYLMNTLRHVSPEMIAMRVRSWSEAHNLMHLVYYIVNGKYFVNELFSADVARKASQLAAELYIRVPDLPQCLLPTMFGAESHAEIPNFIGPKAMNRVMLISKFLDHGYILPVLWIKTVLGYDALTVNVIVPEFGITIRRWLTSTDPSSHSIISVMLQLARAIQYLDSMGIMLSNSFGLDNIFVNSRFHVRISPTELVWPMYGRFLQKVDKRYENNVDKFGELFCTIYFDTELSCTTGTGVETYRPELGVDVDVTVWQLIGRCLSAEGKPSINEVVEEMESWTVLL